MNKVIFLVLVFALAISALVFAEELQQSDGFMTGIELDPVEDETSSSNPCEGVTCNDGNPCTDDSCSDGECSYSAKPDNTVCSDSKVCKSGECVNAPEDQDPNAGGPEPGDSSTGTCVPAIKSIEFDGTKLNLGEQVTVTVDVSNCNASKLVLSVISVDFDNYDKFWKVFQYPAREETSISQEFDAMEAAGIRLESEKFVEKGTMSSFRSYVVDAVELTNRPFNSEKEISLNFSASALDPKFKSERNWMKENKNILMQELEGLVESSLTTNLEAGFFEIPTGLDLGFEGTIGFKLQVKSNGKWKISEMKNVPFEEQAQVIPEIGCETDADCIEHNAKTNDCITGTCGTDSKCSYENKPQGTECITLGNEQGECSEPGSSGWSVCVSTEEPIIDGPGEDKPHDTGGGLDPEDVPIEEIPPSPGPEPEPEPEPVEPEPEPEPVEPEVFDLSDCEPCKTITGCLACLDYQLTAQTEPQ